MGSENRRFDPGRHYNGGERGKFIYGWYSFFSSCFMSPGQEKLPYDLTDMLRRIEKSVKPFPKAAMFELYERGYTSLFEQLISCVVSIRTLDETTIPLSQKLFQHAR